MKLREALESTNPYEIVYIGALSSYVWIGQAGQMINDISEISQIFLRKYIRLHKTMRKRMRRQRDKIADIYGQIITNLDDGESTKKLMQDFSKSVALANKTAGSLRDSENYLITYVPMLEREVQEEYMNAKRQHIIKIPGLEIGMYWDYGEVPKKGYGYKDEEGKG